MSAQQWAKVAGRKAGAGNVQSVGVGQPKAEKKPPKKKPGISAPVHDPAVVEARIRQQVAVEALEHAMESRDIEIIGSAIARFNADAHGTDALWRATMMKKELFAAIKKRPEPQSAAPVAAAVTPAFAAARLEAAMATNDLTTLKAAIAEYEDAAEDTDALEDAKTMMKRLQEERKAEKKKRLKEGGGAKSAPTTEDAAPPPPAAPSPPLTQPTVEATTDAVASMAMSSVPDVSEDPTTPPPLSSASAPPSASALAVAALEAAISGTDTARLDAALLAAHAAGAPLTLITLAVLRRAELNTPPAPPAPTAAPAPPTQGAALPPGVAAGGPPPGLPPSGPPPGLPPGLPGPPGPPSAPATGRGEGKGEGKGKGKGEGKGAGKGEGKGGRGGRGGGAPKEPKETKPERDWGAVRARD